MDEWTDGCFCVCVCVFVCVCVCMYVCVCVGGGVVSGWRDGERVGGRGEGLIGLKDKIFLFSSVKISHGFQRSCVSTMTRSISH